MARAVLVPLKPLCIQLASVCNILLTWSLHSFVPMAPPPTQSICSKLARMQYVSTGKGLHCTYSRQGNRTFRPVNKAKATQ